MSLERVPCVSPLAELVLPGPQHREYLGGFFAAACRRGLRGAAHAGFVATQKRIDLDFEAQGRGQAGVAGGANAVHALLVVEGGAIGRLDRQGKAKVGGRVFMAAKYLRLGRQVPKRFNDAFICSGLPSNIRPQPALNSVSPQKSAPWPQNAMWLTVCPGTCKISNPSPNSGNSQRSPSRTVRVAWRCAHRRGRSRALLRGAAAPGTPPI